MITKTIANLLVKRPKTVLLVFTIITILIGINASNIYMQSELTEYLPKDDPTLQLWTKIDKEFQIGSTIIIYIDQTSRAYDDVRDPKVLTEMDEVIRAIDTSPYDEGAKDGVYSVRSLSSLIKEENAKAELPGGLGGTGRNEIPDDKNLIYRYMARDSINMMKGTLFTNTYKIAIIILQLAEGANYEEVLARSQRAVEKEGNDETDMTITGTTAMQYAIQKYSMENLRIVFPIALVLVSIVIFFFHRTFKGIIIAFLPPAYALALTFGFLGMTNPELSPISISVVALLMGLGVDYSIHLMNRFAEERNLEDNVKRIEKILKSTGKAVLLSMVTTMIGFGSLMISSMSPMVAFGFACAIGIFFCFISAIIMVPCIAMLLKFENSVRIPSWKKFANFAIKNRKRILMVSCFLAIMSLIVLPQVKTDVDYMGMAPEGIPEIETLKEYSNNFGGGTNFNAMLVETDPQGLEHPEVIDAIYNLEREIEKEGVVVFSIADALKEINEILERKTIVARLADIVGAEKIIFDMVANEGVLNKDHSKTIILVSIPVGKSIDELEVLINEINNIVSTTYIPRNGRISQLTGVDAVNVAINKKLTDEQTRSMIIALLFVLAALILILNSSVYGFLTMIPVAFVLIWEPAFLVTFDIPLSVITISIASIMIGIGIDYGVHITQRVREGLSEGLSGLEATRIAIEKTGLSLVEAAVTTIAGIGSIYVVNIPAIQQFALIILFMTALSCIAAALILPVFYNFKHVK
jgi:hypothetical protein